MNTHAKSHDPNQKPSDPTPLLNTSKRSNFAPYRANTYKFLTFVIYWAFTVLVISIIAKLFGKDSFAFEETSNYVLEMVSPKHFIPIIAGPIIVLLAILLVYIPIKKNCWIKEKLAARFDEAIGILKDQLFHISALLFIFTVYALYSNKFNWTWIICLVMVGSLAAFLIWMFPDEPARNHQTSVAEEAAPTKCESGATKSSTT